MILSELQSKQMRVKLSSSSSFTANLALLSGRVPPENEIFSTTWKQQILFMIPFLQFSHPGWQNYKGYLVKDVSLK